MEGEGQTGIELTALVNGQDAAKDEVDGFTLKKDEPETEPLLEDAAKDEVDGFTLKKDEPETEPLLETDGPNGNTLTVDHHRDTEAQKVQGSKQQNDGSNGNTQTVDRDTEAQKVQGGVWFQVKEELGQKVCKDRVPLWAVLVLIFLVLVGIILASLALCTVIYDDVDESYSRALFHVHRNLNGTFQLPNANFTQEPDSNRTQALAADLKSKLDVLFTDSPALGRYFSSSEVSISNAPLSASFQLTFLMPVEESAQLKRFTLSRAMVYNILRQFLLDQEEPSDQGYIEPASLSMSES